MASYTQAALNTAEGGPDSSCELALLLESRVEHKIAPSDLEQLFEAQTQLREKQRELADELKRDQIPREYYYRSLNEAFDHFMYISREILGSEDFEKIYGSEEWDVRGIIDPEIFFAEDIGSQQH